MKRTHSQIRLRDELTYGARPSALAEPSLIETVTGRNEEGFIFWK
jgi:hypothetical protein